ncbi:hypothetical protein [Hoeflea sp.]|uniref:hypothetical protein n=1 Tax=Hoeflea sp. TaxID=1940281 RepID=UPI003B02329C
MHIESAQKWLKAGAAVLVGFGLLGPIGALPATSEITRFFADLAFFPLDGTPAQLDPAARLFWAITGGVIAGWGMMIWIVATRLLPREPALARSMVLTAAVVWFVIDSLGSVFAGAPVNAIYNIGFLALFVVPLWRPIETAARAA